VNSAIVVGGGSVGLCVAEALASRGVAVTTLERDRCGMGASAGNAGWLTPSLAIPIPGPGVIGQSLRWLVNPSGPLWIRPTLSPAMLEWIAQFALYCRRSAYRRGLAALQTAAARTAISFERLTERGAQFEHHEHELLYPAFSSAELEHLLSVATDLRDAGSKLAIERLGGAEITALEPALSASVVGGLLAHGEERVRPESLAAGVRRHVEALGSKVIENTDVVGLSANGAEWIARSPGSEWRADAIVLANGVPAAQLLSPLGVRIPVAAAKGYSRTFVQTDSGPKRPVYLEQPKVAISVFDGAARISGTLELGAQTLALSQRRLKAITSAAREAMPGWNLPPHPTDWAGMRSMSPDGLPYVGAVPGLERLYVATGHATLGITLAPLSGELLADLMLDGGRDPLLEAFDPARAVRGLTAKTTTGGTG
jgi:D-amino-acid dehydrogenase